MLLWVFVQSVNLKARRNWQDLEKIIRIQRSRESVLVVGRNTDVTDMLRKFPSIDKSLEEARLVFQYQQNRFQNIEAKASAFLTLNSILFAIVWLVNGSWFLVLAQICLVVSVFFSFRVFWLRQGKFPHDKEKWYDYAKLKTGNSLDQFLLNYSVAIKNEDALNEKKVKDLQYVVLFSAIAWIIFAIAWAYPVIRFLVCVLK